ncbi:VMAP-C domain-containing protein [Streptomyces hydrogenans]|uniref:VMAP-C domain-containing protein n=1 Tax=Streptomyces hydrogenans TaxID=1873719 RepID=UPI00167E9774|nr:hypothetical protein [Streptomyces hydrogenans]
MTGGLLYDEGHGAHASDLTRELVDQLCAVPGLETTDGRGLLIDTLADQLPEAANIPRHNRLRPGVLEIVRFCRREPGGLHELAAALALYDPGSAPALHVRGLIAAAPPAAVLPALPDSECLVVTGLLDRVRHLDAHGLLYAAADGIPLPLHPVATLGEAFSFLTRANTRPDGLLPTMVLVEHVAAGLDGRGPDDTRTADALREWNDVQAKKLERRPALEAVRTALGRPHPAQPAPACVVVQLCRSGMHPDRYLLSHWRQMRPGPWRPERGEDRLVTLDEVPAAVERLLQRAEQDWARQPGRPVLEFVLPVNLLNEPMEWFPVAFRPDAATALCLTYPVVLRSLERMRATEFHRRWHNRWQQALDSPDTACHWDTAGSRGHDREQWTSTLTADERLVSVALSAPPLPEDRDRDGSQASLIDALYAGVPMAVWDRRSSGSADFRKRARRLLTGKAIELPQRVHQLRKDAATAAAGKRDAHVGRHLAVLFDDPNRLVDWSGAPGSDLGSARGGHHEEGET